MKRVILTCVVMIFLNYNFIYSQELKTDHSLNNTLKKLTEAYEIIRIFKNFNDNNRLVILTQVKERGKRILTIANISDNNEIEQYYSEEIGGFIPYNIYLRNDLIFIELHSISSRKKSYFAYQLQEKSIHKVLEWSGDFLELVNVNDEELTAKPYILFHYLDFTGSYYSVPKPKGTKIYVWSEEKNKYIHLKTLWYGKNVLFKNRFDFIKNKDYLIRHF